MPENEKHPAQKPLRLLGLAACKHGRASSPSCGATNSGALHRFGNLSTGFLANSPIRTLFSRFRRNPRLSRLTLGPSLGFTDRFLLLMSY